MMNILKIWLRAIRAPFFTAVIIPVILGTSIALHSRGQFNLFLFCLTLAGVVFANAGTNLTNDYYDHRGRSDPLNKNPTPFSGGSRVIQNGLISAEKILRAALVFFVLAISIGLYLNHICHGNIILILAFLGGFLGFFYTADPLRIGYRGMGELVVGFELGPLLVLGSYYVQTQNLSWEPVWGSIPVGLLIALVLYLNEFPDYEPDKKVGKKTLVVILGKKRALNYYCLFLGLTYLWLIFGVLLRIFPFLALITLLTLPLFFKAIATARKNFDKIYSLIPANAATIILHLSVGLLLSGAYLLDTFL